jgi:hypothetical protein
MPRAVEQKQAFGFCLKEQLGNPTIEFTRRGVNR